MGRGCVYVALVRKSRRVAGHHAARWHLFDHAHELHGQGDRPAVCGGAELAQFLFIWTAVLGADITLRRGGQVRIDAFVIRMPLKYQYLVTGLCVSLMALFLVLLIWYGFPLAISNWQRPMGVAGLSYGYITLALPVGAALMLISLVRRVVSHGVVGCLIADDDDVVEEAL